MNVKITRQQRWDCVKEEMKQGDRYFEACLYNSMPCATAIYIHPHTFFQSMQVAPAASLIYASKELGNAGFELVVRSQLFVQQYLLGCGRRIVALEPFSYVVTIVSAGEHRQAGGRQDVSTAPSGNLAVLLLLPWPLGASKSNHHRILTCGRRMPSRDHA